MKTILFLLFTFFGQDVYRPMLGESEPENCYRTSVEGIKICPQGFDNLKPNKTKKTIKWLRNNNLDRFENEFKNIATTLDNLSMFIDEDYKTQLKVWTDCGGIYRQVGTFDPRIITLTIESKPFIVTYYGNNILFSEVVNGDSIRTVVSHVHSSLSFMQNYRSLFKWALGNYWQCKIFGCAKDSNSEIGNRIPCK